MTDKDNYIRAIAGLTLKNNILNSFNATPLFVLDHVKSVCTRFLEFPDPDATIRRTVGSVITAIVVRGQIMNWPNIMSILANKLDSPNPLSIEVFYCRKHSAQRLELVEDADTCAFVDGLGHNTDDL